MVYYVIFVYDRWSLSTVNADEENHVEPTDRLTVVVDNDGDQLAAESANDRQQREPTAATATETTAAAAVAKGDRSGRQMYQPFAAYQSVFPQRRAYRGPKKRPPRTKSGRRPRPHRRRPSGPPSSSRYRRLPGPVRAQHVNYIDPTAASVDYYDDDGSVFEAVGPQQSAVMSSLGAPYLDYVEQREFDRDPTAYAVMPSPMTTGRSRKRPTIGGYADEPQVVHVPVLRVIRPTVMAAAATTAATTTSTAATVDPMEKLRQLVHEAMDAHFANRHQDLYTADGTFDNKQQRQHVYSAKYKRQQAAVDKDKAAPAAQVDAVRSVAAPSAKNKDQVLQYVSYATPPPPPADVDADGSDDRLTLAEISAYMGAKPAETVLSAGGHRYVLSDALQQSYRQQQQEQQLQYGSDGHHQYLRYVSPFEAMYELPAARWAYK